METVLSRINIADTNELAETVESWRGVSGGASFPDDPRCQKAWVLPIVKRNWDNVLRDADQVSRSRLLATALKESGAWLNAFPFSSIGTLLDSLSIILAIALRVGAVFVFLILSDMAWGWTVECLNSSKQMSWGIVKVLSEDYGFISLIITHFISLLQIPDCSSFKKVWNIPSR